MRYEGVVGDSNNVFAKASFVSDASGESGDIVDVNDPEFWQKMLPDATTTAAQVQDSLFKLTESQPLGPLSQNTTQGGGSCTAVALSHKAPF